MNENVQTVYSGRFLDMVERDGWEFVERKDITGIVAVVAVNDDDHLILVDQYRPPFATRVMELPAGIAGDIPGQHDEALETAARRELLEETGYEASEMTRLCAGVPSAGLTNEMVTFYRATGLTKVAAGGGDDDEDIRVVEVHVTKVDEHLEQWEADGYLFDFKLLAGLYYVRCDV